MSAPRDETIDVVGEEDDEQYIGHRVVQPWALRRDDDPQRFDAFHRGMTGNDQWYYSNASRDMISVYQHHAEIAVRNDTIRLRAYDIYKPLNFSKLKMRGVDSFNQYGADITDMEDAFMEGYATSRIESNDRTLRNTEKPGSSEELLYVSKEEIAFLKEYFEESEKEEGMLTSPRAWLFFTGQFKNLEKAGLDVMHKVFEIQIREALSRANKPLDTTILSLSIDHPRFTKGNIFNKMMTYEEVKREWSWKREQACMQSELPVLDGQLTFRVYMQNRFYEHQRRQLQQPQQDDQ